MNSASYMQIKEQTLLLNKSLYCIQFLKTEKAAKIHSKPVHFERIVQLNGTTYMLH